MTDTQHSPVIAITGATGFIGQRLLKFALQNNYQVRALTRQPQKSTDRVTWIEGDLENKEALTQLVKNADIVVHMAGLTKGLNWQQFEAVNIQATETILAFSKQHCPNAHFIHISSLAAQQPRLSHYAKSKRLSEDSVRQLWNETGRWTILRPPAVYGPGDKEMIAVWKMMQKGYAFAPGSSSNRFAMIHADDVAKAILAVALQADAFGHNFELDDGKSDGYTTEDLATAFSLISGFRVKIFTLPAPLVQLAGYCASFGAMVTGNPTMLSHKKANELLYPRWLARHDRLNESGLWAPEYPLSKGLRKTLESYAGFTIEDGPKIHH